jgi:hypothetical protein
MSLSLQPNCRDKVDGILERRLGQVLDTQLIEAYLKLDADQLASRKVRGIFTKVILPPTILIQAKDFAARNPSNLIITWLDSIRYILTIATSSFTLSRLMSQNARNLILLSTIKVFANLYRLAEAYCTTPTISLTLCSRRSPLRSPQ